MGHSTFPVFTESACDATEHGWRHSQIFSIAYAVAGLTHLPSLVVFGAIPCLYCAFLAPRGKRLLSFAIACARGNRFSALALYLLPLLANAFITSDYFTTGDYVYTRNFYHLQSVMAFFLIIVPLIGLFTELPAAMRRDIDKQGRFWIVILGFRFYAHVAAAMGMDKPSALPAISLPFLRGDDSGRGIAGHRLANSHVKAAIYAWFTLSALLFCVSWSQSIILPVIRRKPMFSSPSWITSFPRRNTLRIDA